MDSYEKKYKEALERAKEFQKSKDGLCVLTAESIFPELRESEDEKTRKEIIEFIRSQIEDGNSVGWDRWIAWLDEQKEQKPSINIDQLKSLMLQYLQEAANEKDDSSIEADTDKWARKILGYDFEQKPSWGEEDEKNLELVTDCVYEFYPDPVMKYKLKDWLKSLKDIGNFPKSNTDSPSGWSEEDEKIRKNLMSLLANMRGDRITEETYQKYYPWLKSLRSSWKPSEEQMEALKEDIDFAPDTYKLRCTLVSLYNDLKKL